MLLLYIFDLMEIRFNFYAKISTSIYKVPTFMYAHLINCELWNYINTPIFYKLLTRPIKIKFISLAVHNLKAQRGKTKTRTIKSLKLL